MNFVGSVGDYPESRCKRKSGLSYDFLFVFDRSDYRDFVEIPGIKIVRPPQEALNYLQEKGHKTVLLSVVRICIMHF